MQITPLPSMTSAPGALTAAPTATIVPLRTCTSPRAKSPSASSIVSTCAPRTTNSLRAGRLAPDAPLFCAKACPGSHAAALSAVVPASSVRRLTQGLGIVSPHYCRVTRGFAERNALCILQANAARRPFPSHYGTSESLTYLNVRPAGNGSADVFDGGGDESQGRHVAQCRDRQPGGDDFASGALDAAEPYQWPSGG